ncbi:MAG: YlxR family protein [Actinobacteria bacterium]|nr:YlxR family protein [Actinomycetota bacterium]
MRSRRSPGRRGARLRDEPIRTCVGCGRKAPQRELLRYVARGGELGLDPDGRAAGRGAYTCRRRACFERAASRRAFARTLRRNVRIPADLWPEEL